MSKELSQNEVVSVNFCGKIVHARICGFKGGALQADVSPVGGIVPLFLDDAKDPREHEGDLHACYYTPDETPKSAAPQFERFEPTAPTAKVTSPKTENFDVSK
jgi:hypothetical protein